MALKERLVRFRSFWVFPLLAIVLLTLSRQAEPGRAFAELFWLVPAGALIWTILEYGLHRCAFHMENRETKLGHILTASHLAHHAAPRDPDKVLVHTSFAVPVSVLLLAALYGMSRSIFVTSGLISGIWAGFLYYELVHYRVHCTVSNSRVISRQRRTHFHHHFSNPAESFGVTSPLWDYVFRSAGK